MSRNEDFHNETPEVASYGKYLIEDTGKSLIWARTHDPKKPAGLGRRVGSLSFFGGKIDRNEDGTIDDRSNINGGRIHKVYVSSQFRRKGIASAMLDFARERYPDKEVRHSNALSDDGRAWAEKKP
jgi:ribosomal protein S18 acetylase RimI-like enzyme